MTSNGLKYVSVEQKENISIVRFNRDDSKNALSFDALRELKEVALRFDGDSKTSAIVLTGASNVFTVGFDLQDPETSRLNNLSLSERRQVLRIGPDMCRTWEKLEPITIIAIEGWCVGGGVALSLSCDLRVSGKSAISFAPEIQRGMNMSWQAVPRSVALIGPAKTKRLFIMAERLTAQKGLEWGYYDAVSSDGDTLITALEMAKKVAAMPPVQVRMIKEGINAAAFALANSVSTLDRDQYLLALSSDDYREGLQSFFEKRPPKYTGK